MSIVERQRSASAQTCPVEYRGKSLGIQDLYGCFIFAAIFVLILDGCESATVEDRSAFLILLKTLFGLQLVETDVTEHNTRAV